MSRQKTQLVSRRGFLKGAITIAGATAAMQLGKLEPIMAEQARRTIAGIASQIRSAGGSQQQMVQRVFDTLRVGSPTGLTQVTSGMDTRPPNTAAQTLTSGGDCTEFAAVAAEVLQQLGIPGGARVVHFRGNPDTSEHMVAFANIGGTETTIDLQAPRLGAYARPIDRVVSTLTYAEAEGMYHREMGNHHAHQGRADAAITSFEEAVRINPRDAYSHHRLGALLGRRGRGTDRQRASREHLLALQHDPTNQLYLRNAAPAAYNAGFDSYDAGRTDEARGYFEQCRDISTRLQAGEGGASGRSIGAQYHQECVSALGQL